MQDTAQHAKGDMVALGRVVKPHGVRGCIRILLFNPRSESFSKLKTVYLKSPATNGLKSFGVQQASRHKQLFIVQLEGVNNLGEAEALRDWLVYAPKSELSELGEDEYYYYELIGMDAYSESGELIGRIKGFITTPAHDVLVIKNGDKELMLPWIDGVMVDVDQKNGRVVLETVGLIVDSEQG